MRIFDTGAAGFVGSAIVQDLIDTGYQAERDTRLEDFAGELTAAVYPILQRQGVKREWIAVELELWAEFADTVRQWVWKRPAAGHRGELESWREGLLLDLRARASSVAQRHVLSSLPELEPALTAAFRHGQRRYLNVH